ncbi:MAG: hypothetical protein ACP6IP_06350 [Candidatus Njordarchaeia archaeon]
MSGVRYIMVTNLRNHWDNLPNNKTSYPFGMLKNLDIDKVRELGEIVGAIPTIFIKIDGKTKVFERSWEGYTRDFRVDKAKGKIFFKVEISQEIRLPEKYQNLREGWYVEEENQREITYRNVITGASLFDETKFYPPVFYNLVMNTDPYDFENSVYYLLKLLGIHDIIKYEQQSGHPDGFFRFRRLAVVYDATLMKNFIYFKSQQIDNYCGLLKKGEIGYEETYFTISECEKQVWIITKGATRRIKQIDEVIIKEISIYDLIKLYIDRIKQNLKENELEKKLKEL